MKRFLFVGVMAAATMVATVSKAEAVVSLSVRICQGGLLCQDFGPVNGPGPILNANITVGDYNISGLVGSLETAALSNAATNTIAVRRLTDVNAGDLQVWLTATDYALPIATGYAVRTTFAATSSEGPAASNATFQGWASFSNATGFPPAGSITPGLMNCALAAGTGSCDSGTSLITTNSGAQPFSMVTLTTFTVPTVSTSATYTTTGQINITAVPEPASMLLLGSGLVALAAAARRRRRS